MPNGRIRHCGRVPHHFEALPSSYRDMPALCRFCNQTEEEGPHGEGAIQAARLRRRGLALG